jgi:hypothetical protein
VSVTNTFFKANCSNFANRKQCKRIKFHIIIFRKAVTVYKNIFVTTRLWQAYIIYNSGDEMDDKKQPIRFPENLIADNLSIKPFHIIEPDDITDEQEATLFAQFMFENMGRGFYLYSPYGGAGVGEKEKLLKSAGILRGISQAHYYRMAGSDRFYRRILPHSDEAAFFLEGDLVDRQMYYKTELLLSPVAIRHLEVLEHLEIAGEMDACPLIVEPNFYGLGIRPKKVWVWIKAKINRFRRGKRGS